MPLQTQRYDAGVGVLKQVGGRDYDAPLKALEDIAPDLARFTVEFAYGDIMSRAALGLKTRQIATVAALAAMGNAQPQLRYHINGALNVGWAPSQISEAILLSTVYAGFPAALKGVFAAKEVFEQRGSASLRLGEDHRAGPLMLPNSASMLGAPLLAFPASGTITQELHRTRS
jgi:4-carboxymuconolactone decarboxylase